MAAVQELIKRSRIHKNDAEFILQVLLDVNKSNLYVKDEIPNDIVDKFKELAKIKRKTKAPVQYITGKAFFYGYEFSVLAGAFIPRPETEILVEQILRYISSQRTDKKLSVIELGAGIGNISLALAVNSSKLDITAVEINSLAWQCAGLNKKRFESQKILKSPVNFMLGDMLSVMELDKNYDVVMSNPPYLPFSILEKLPDEVKQEPHTALFAAENGMFFYRKIMEMCVNGLLRKNGVLFFEIPEDNVLEIKELAIKNGFKDPIFVKDLTGRFRIAQIFFKRGGKSGK